MTLTLRPVRPEDKDAFWHIFEPILRAGTTYALPRDMQPARAWAYWGEAPLETWVAEDQGSVLGSYYLKANALGGGAHVGNCGYIVADHAQGRGIASALCAHSLERARAQGFKALQFNCVVSTNTRAIALWERFGFQTVGRLPGAFSHPEMGEVDALVMYQRL
ncbi:GNAT family N-acetyltransferase [Larsenimonas salina]|uniref:GNAT family N-acetyltransferase n=1 Tax=Larsenimonas salina TaxID=1295565 RepID=UPI0020731475|nr:N-acetyltransferase [Larsenimonas salina]MCM5705400.1 GNAT family N-acetyltransferase [Larsenimonas salina]